MMYPTVATLPFRKIYGIDFEYCSKDGAIPEIVCMVVQDLNTNEVSRYWATELYDMSDPPFETGQDVALITYFAPAGLPSAAIIYYAFLRRIQKEKKQLEIKGKILEKSGYQEVMYTERYEGDMAGMNASYSDMGSIKENIETRMNR